MIKVENEELIADPIKYLNKMKQSVVERMEKLSQLNLEYRQKQQKQFMKIFLFVMDKMSTQLCQADKMYKNIDNQIQGDPKCLQLSTKLKFFKNQCLYLREQLDKTQDEIRKQREKQKQLTQQRQLIQSTLFQKSKQLYRYKTLARSYKIQQQKQGLKTQVSEHKSRFRSKADQIEKVPKNISFTQTKNTKLSSFSHLEIPKEKSPRNRQNSEAQFSLKAARLAKQRKLMMSKSYYSNSNRKKAGFKHQTLQILK